MSARRGHKGAYGRHVGKRARRWKRGVPCRCSVCGRRRTLSQRPEDYHQRQRATCCGRLLRVDWYRWTGAENLGQTCTCKGYHSLTYGQAFPHRRGSLFCRHGGAGWAAGFMFVDRGSDEFIDWCRAGMPPRRWEHAA